MIKACSRCWKFFDATEFYPDSRLKDGLQGECRKCRNSEAIKWQKQNPRSRRNTHLKSKFGITIEQFDSLLKLQNHCCAICMSPTPRGRGTFHVDHCHKTGTVRGLLCHDCNTGIGKFGDNVKMLQKAIDYLECFNDA
jgi:hypothetical protein